MIETKQDVDLILVVSLFPRLIGLLGTDHLIFRGGGWDFFEKNSLFPYTREKNKMSSTKLKIKSLFFIQ